MSKDNLEAYRQKRDFGSTSEPAGKRAAHARAGGRSALRFVVQRHAARSLHYDFRLEMDGVLKSWAVPKGPSLDPDNKRLAVEVEDHPLDYGNFEGEIPAGQYGAGQVQIWDAGLWLAENDPLKALEQGHLRFTLEGTHLKGDWLLVRTRLQGRQQQWLLRKLDDSHAERGHDAEAQKPIGRRRARASSRTSAAPGTPAKAKTAATAKTPETRGHATSKTRPDAGPATLSFQLATLADTPPAGDDWIYELKYDGYRMMCRIDGKEVRFLSRTGKDWTQRLGELPAKIAAMKLGHGWIDGEVLVFDEAGRSSFQLLQASLDGQTPCSATFVAFDLPYWEGKDKRGQPWQARRAALESLLPSNKRALRYLQASEVLAPEDGQAAADLWEQACSLQLEGLIGKRAQSPYRAGRSSDWIKLKCRPRQELVVLGYTPPQGARSGFGALLLGVFDEDGTLRYAGKVGTGFDEATIRSLKHDMDALKTKASPLAGEKPIPAVVRRQGVQWLEPRLVAEISFSNWTEDGLLRQASYIGLRKDKRAQEVQREVPVAQHEIQARPSSAPDNVPSPKKRDRPMKSGSRTKTVPKDQSQPPTKKPSDTVAGIVITHPDRLIYDRPALTKLDLARYYESIGEQLLPHLQGRRLALLRCPQGSQGSCFFQKHLHEEPPNGVGLDGDMVVVHDIEGIVALVQRGVIEFHTWGAVTNRPNTPERITFDLDPGPGIGWRKLAQAADVTRALLQELGMEPLLKTTGGKGLHLVVPLKGRAGWQAVEDFAQAVARHLQDELPDRFIAKAAKSSRKGLVFVDYLRNGEGATAVSAFSARARPGAPVSMPVPWDALQSPRDLRGHAYNVRNALRAVKARQDPWQDYESLRVSLTQAIRKRLP